eukprot:scaffold6338_cov139-Isochrysis_galbana.AAC.4
MDDRAHELATTGSRKRESATVLVSAEWLLCASALSAFFNQRKRSSSLHWDAGDRSSHVAHRTCNDYCRGTPGRTAPPSLSSLHAAAQASRGPRSSTRETSRICDSTAASLKCAVRTSPSPSLESRCRGDIRQTHEREVEVGISKNVFIKGHGRAGDWKMEKEAKYSNILCGTRTYFAAVCPTG